jgi:hypothetical protein
VDGEAEKSPEGGGLNDLPGGEYDRWAEPEGSGYLWALDPLTGQYVQRLDQDGFGKGWARGAGSAACAGGTGGGAPAGAAGVLAGPVGTEASTGGREAPGADGSPAGLPPRTEPSLSRASRVRRQRGGRTSGHGQPGGDAPRTPGCG